MSQQPRHGLIRSSFVPGQRNDAFFHLTLRNILIATHDALATMLALFASFYLRFEGDAFFDRLPLLLRILPYFVAFSVAVSFVFNLTTTKWRFISLPDALNILRVATVLALGLVVLDYVFVAPKFTAGRWRQCSGRVLSRQNRDRSLLVPRGVFSKRVTLRLSLFSLYAGAASREDRGRITGASCRTRC
jgi:hypothetical protein